MPQYSLSPDRLFDRPWRPGHPFRPKLGRFRRIGMVLLLAVLCSIIFTYGRLTDSERVRHMAEGYLSDLIGCRVKVGGATLSVFEGLRLDDVRVYVDDDPTPPGTAGDGDGSTRPSSTTARSPHAAPDAEVFSARTFVIRYDYRSMLRGQLEATQIIAEKPHVLLTRDARRGSWNFRRIDPTRRAHPGPSPSSRPSMPHKVPELLLRSARVELSELRDGTRARLGYLAIDGQLTPEPTGERCNFVLQSRGVSDAVGALISGWVQLDTGQAFAEVRQLEFGGDLQSLLFEGPREWWARHELAGRVKSLTLDYAPARGAEPARFSVRTELEDVNLAFPAEELMSGAEVRRRENTRDAVETIRSVYAIAGCPPLAAPPVPNRGERDVPRSPSLGANNTPSADAAPIIPISLASPRGARSTAVSREPAPADDEPPAVPAPPPPPVVGADRLAEFLATGPLRLLHVSGPLAFTEAGVTIDGIKGSLEKNAFQITGHVDGYSPDAPMAMRITSVEGEDLIIPPDPKYVWSLPRDIRDIYQGLCPQGACRLRFDLTRRDEGGPLDCEGAVEIVDGSFLLKEFPYPLREVSGEVRFGRDRQNGWNWVSLRNIRGKGVAGGPNQNSAVTVDGWIGPIGPGVPDAGFNIRVVADDISSEPALVGALDPDVRQALRLFDAPGKGEYPQFRGRVVCDVVRPIGQDQRFTYNTDIHLTDAAGIMAGFPYPLRHVAGDLKVRDGYVDVVGVTMKRSNATMNVDGRVAFASPEEWTRARAAAARATPVPGAPRQPEDATPPRTDLRVAVRALPVDDDLLASLPADQRDWVRRMGVNGRIDVDGELTSRAVPATAPVTSASAASASGAAPEDGPPINYDLWITLKDGTVRPQGGAFVAADVLGRLHLTPDYLQIVDVRGHRGAAELGGAGLITWPGGKSNVVLSAWAKNLLLEKALYDVLPEAAQQSWDEVQPLGTIDATVTYATPREGSGLAGTALRQGAAAPIVAGPVTGVIAVDLTRDPTFDAVGVGPVATLAPPEVPPGLHAKLRPRDLSVTLRTVPYRLDRLAGTIAVSPGMVRLKDVTGRHGKATLAVSGTGTTDDRPVWNLAVSGQNLLVDDELHRALPPSLAAICDSLKLSGTLGFTLPRLLYRTGDDASPGVATPARGSAPATSTGPAVTQPASPPPGVEISGAIYLVDAKLDAGVQLEDVNGAINIAEATVRNGHLDALKGDVSLDSLSMAARPVRVLKAQMIKPSGKSELRLADLQARIAGGDLAGQVTLAFPDDGPSRYTLGLVVRNADVRELGWESDQKIAGRLTASLSLEGSWDKVSERRGRGDVVVAGKDMYHIPLLLGLLQVTNLALPISAPFERGVVRYSVEGQRVVFEHVELRSNNMLMSGDGNLDFGTRQVNMTFVTDNPGGFQVPFLQDLWRGAQHELLRIHVRGSIQEPKVQTSTMGTFTTTVDEVFKGEKGDTQRKGRK